MRKRPTGTPDTGEPYVRFGGRGGVRSFRPLSSKPLGKKVICTSWFPVTMVQAMLILCAGAVQLKLESNLMHHIII